MKAVGYRASLPITAGESLVDLELPKPEPGPRDLRVAVRAVSVNPVDTKVRVRAAPEPGGVRVLGYDAAGIVDAVGSEVTLFRPGDEVFYAGVHTRPGADAEFHLVDERIVGHKPRSLGFADASALPLTALTAWELLFTRLQATLGKTHDAGALLILGGAGGVGSVLIQIARRLTGLTVIATASRPDTVAWCRDLGAHHVINHHEDLAAQLKAAGHEQVRYVAALTGTEQHLPVLPGLMEPQGRLAVTDDPKALDIMPFKQKAISVHWEFMFARPIWGTPDLVQQHLILDEVADLVDAGVLRTTARENLGRITAANLKRAHGAIESGRTIGKIVLEGF